MSGPSTATTTASTATVMISSTHQSTRNLPVEPLVTPTDEQLVSAGDTIVHDLEGHVNVVGAGRILQEPGESMTGRIVGVTGQGSLRSRTVQPCSSDRPRSRDERGRSRRRGPA